MFTQFLFHLGYPVPRKEQTQMATIKIPKISCSKTLQQQNKMGKEFQSDFMVMHFCKYKDTANISKYLKVSQSIGQLTLGDCIFVGNDMVQLSCSKHGPTGLKSLRHLVPLLTEPCCCIFGLLATLWHKYFSVNSMLNQLC